MTQNIYTGGPAFPHGNHHGQKLPGMNLRDYFAAKVLDRMMSIYYQEYSSDGEPFKMVENLDVSMTALMIAEECYAMADAMLKAREQ